MENNIVDSDSTRRSIRQHFLYVLLIATEYVNSQRLLAFIDEIDRLTYILDCQNWKYWPENLEKEAMR